ncbi:MAG TPA: glycosyltransferase family 87 protein [Drouetiella sp.]
MRLEVVLPKILAIFLLVIPPLVAVSQPVLMQGSDFVMTFYPVGKLILSGRASDIYPPLSATSLVEAPFNKYVHELLKFIPPEYVGIYMYSPLMAVLLAPFAVGGATEALVAWELLSVLVLALVAYICSGGERSRALDYFFMFALFCPVFHTLLIGHLGIVVGLLPLALGYVFLRGAREGAAGFVWGALLLKPQFLPTAMLVAGSLFLAKRPRAALGLLCGLVTFGLLSCFALGPEIFFDWLKSFKMSDTIFAHAGYGFPAYMVVSLPAVLLQFFPFEARAQAKIFIYGLAGAIGLFALWRSTLILRSGAVSELKSSVDAKARAEVEKGVAVEKAAVEKAAEEGAVSPALEQMRQYQAAVSLVMLIGLLVLPLVLPHFLFYDMCGLALIAVLAYQGHLWNGERIRVWQIRVLIWWVLNLYYLSFMFLPVRPLGHWFACLPVLFFAFLFWLAPGVAARRVVPNPD